MVILNATILIVEKLNAVIVSVIMLNVVVPLEASEIFVGGSKIPLNENLKF
jgi:hypothetical protein